MKKTKILTISEPRIWIPARRGPSRILVFDFLLYHPNLRNMWLVLFLSLGLVVCQARLCEAGPFGTAFTYQGHLYDANRVADGLYDFQFKLFDDPNVVSGNQIGIDVNKPEVDVINGYFTLLLDFNDANAFNGNARWLEIGVRPGELNDPNIYTILEPRQEVMPTPYALYAKTAAYAENTARKISSTTFVVAASDSKHKNRADYICDGTDDHVEIQAAIDALPSRGGKIVLLEGKFVTSATINLKAQVVIEGQGIGGNNGEDGTSIVLASGSNCHMLEYHKTSGSADFITLKEFYLDGNATNNPTGGHGIYMHSTGAVSVMDVLIDHVWVAFCKQDGFCLTGNCSDTFAWGFYIRSCLAEYNGGRGLYGWMRQCYLLTGYYAYNGNSGVCISNSENVALLGIMSRMNDTRGFHINNSDYVTMSSCTACENSEAGQHSYDNFFIQNSDYFTLTGAESTDDTSNNVRYGIYVENSKGVITGCNVHNIWKGFAVSPDPCPDVLLGVNYFDGTDTDVVGTAAGFHTKGNKIGVNTQVSDAAFSVFRTPSSTAGQTALGLAYADDGHDVWGLRLEDTTYDMILDRKYSDEWHANICFDRNTGNVLIGDGSVPSASALLELKSTAGALLLPRMTTTQRDALTAVNGMVIYNTTTNRLEAYENKSWVDL